jgi:hypothetical protein
MAPAIDGSTAVITIAKANGAMPMTRAEARACAAMTSASRCAEPRARNEDASASKVCAAPPPNVWAMTIAAATICRAGESDARAHTANESASGRPWSAPGEHHGQLAAKWLVELVARFAQRDR